MDVKKLQFVQGSPQRGETATIKFMDSVDYWSVSSFKDEFEWLDEHVEPSKIIILINSEGGDVIRGMDAFSAIMNAKAPTECIVEGLAASMGSILLAAGNVSKMRDYGLVMIHNPFAKGAPKDDPAIAAFITQLKTIYKKRWGLTDEKIKSIMDGEDGEDGTWMNSDEAVEAGIILRENVIITPEQEKKKIDAALNGIESKSKIAQVLACINPKMKQNIKPDKIDNNIDKTKIKKSMDEKLTSVAAALSLDKEATEADVLAKVVALGKVESRVSTLEKENSELATVKAGLETSLSNIKGELETKNAELTKAVADVDAYKKKEAEAIQAQHLEFVEAAITSGKIKTEAKDQWLAIADANFDACKTAIDGIEGRVIISQEIQLTGEEAAKQLTVDEKAKAESQAKIDAAIGKDFKFETV